MLRRRSAHRLTVTPEGPARLVPLRRLRPAGQEAAMERRVDGELVSPTGEKTDRGGGPLGPGLKPGAEWPLSVIPISPGWWRNSAVWAYAGASSAPSRHGAKGELQCSRDHV